MIARLFLPIIFLLICQEITAQINANWHGKLSDNWKETVSGKIPETGFFDSYGDLIVLGEEPTETDFKLLSEAIEFRGRNRDIHSLEPLSPFTQLEIIDCSSNPVKKIKPLKAMTNLRVLDLTETKVSNLAPIRNLQLRELYCGGIIFLSTIQDLDEMVSLQILICNNNSLQHIDAVRKLVNLQILDASENYIDNVEPVRQLSQLRELILFDNPIFEIFYLADLENLEKLHLDATGIFELRPLDALSKLTFLSVIETPYLTIEEIERFAANKKTCELLVR